MFAARTLRPALAATAILLLTATSAARADGDSRPKGWDPTRTTSPESVVELKSLESKVKEVVAACTPATVGLFVGPSAGSGVIVSDDGLILTAAHVIGSRPNVPVTVVLADGKRVAGKTLGVNPEIDSGMVRITGKVPEGATWAGAKEGKWPFAPVGKSTDLKRGQWVVALGHPGGPKLDRRPPVRVGRFYYYNTKEVALRSDCTLVGGDSGGPLFDLSGKVIGIHSRIGRDLEYNIHVPTDAFEKEWDQLAGGKNSGKPAGVELGVVPDDTAEAPTVKSVVENSPASRAGFQAGDVILKFGDEQVHTFEDLVHLLAGVEPGQKVPVEVQRDGKTVTLTVTFRRARRQE
jgi:serine protease Do